MNALEKDVCDYIVDKLKEFVNCTEYCADLATLLLEDENQQGFVTPYEKESRKWAISHFWDIETKLKETWEPEISGYIQKKFWDDPNGFMVCIYIETARDLLSQCKTIDENWNEKIELDEDTIQQIIKELEAL